MYAIPSPLSLGIVLFFVFGSGSMYAASPVTFSWDGSRVDSNGSASRARVRNGKVKHRRPVDAKDGVVVRLLAEAHLVAQGLLVQVHDREPEERVLADGQIAPRAQQGLGRELEQVVLFVLDLRGSPRAPAPGRS